MTCSNLYIEILQNILLFYVKLLEQNLSTGGLENN